MEKLTVSTCHESTLLTVRVMWAMVAFSVCTIRVHTPGLRAAGLRVSIGWTKLATATEHFAETMAWVAFALPPAAPLQFLKFQDCASAAVTPTAVSHSTGSTRAGEAVQPSASASGGDTWVIRQQVSGTGGGV